MSSSPSSLARCARLGIGTVQFGTVYGIANLRGQVDRDSVRQILEVAQSHGVSLLDTAAMYGQAEEVIGSVTKLVPGYSIITKTTTGALGIREVVETARRSQRILGAKPVHGLLVHTAADLYSNEGSVLWQALLRLRDEGLFEKIGISAYGTDDPLSLARQFKPDIMQVPLSVLDQRLAQSGVLHELKNLGVEVHTRSAFLQGAIFLDPEQLPPALERTKPSLKAFHRRRESLGLTPLQVGIAYPLSLPEVDRVIVGMSSVEEAREILEVASAPTVTAPWGELAASDESLLDPRLWTSTKKAINALLPVSRGRPFVAAFIQARMSSSRLPGKVLKPLLGRPMLGRQLDRLKRCTTIDRLIVVTSVEKSDDSIAAFCANEGVDFYRGPLEDVLARYEGAVRENSYIDHIVRLPADCPLADPNLIDLVVRTHLDAGNEYTANMNPGVLPGGLVVEVMSRGALATAAAQATDPYDREHVTPYLYRTIGAFKVGSVAGNVGASPQRLTVDTPADFQFVEAIYRELLPSNEYFNYGDILSLLSSRPDIAAINSPPSA